MIGPGSDKNELYVSAKKNTIMPWSLCIIFTLFNIHYFCVILVQIKYYPVIQPNKVIRCCSCTNWELIEIWLDSITEEWRRVRHQIRLWDLTIGLSFSLSLTSHRSISLSLSQGDFTTGPFSSFFLFYACLYLHQIRLCPTGI